jgi:hypothetical protein
MSEIWIPIIATVCFTAIIITLSVLNSRHKSRVQSTIQLLLEKGEQITPELLDKLGTHRSQKIIDLRRGLALVALGLACILSGLVLQDLPTGVAFGVFPLMLGLAFLLTWKINQPND